MDEARPPPMTPIERAREAAAKAVIAASVMSDDPIQVSVATRAANAALDAFLASLAEDGMVVVPRAELDFQLTTIADHKNNFDVPSLKGSMEYLAARIRATIEAATSPPPPEGQG